MPIKELIEGFRSFCDHYFNGGETIYSELVEKGQSPRAAVVACADSRVSPNTLMQAKPGDLFVIRNVANLVQPPESANGNSTISGLEYAVLHLEVEHVIIIGHSHCGGIQALIDGPSAVEEQFPHVASWVSPFEPIRGEVLQCCAGASKQETARIMEKAAVRTSLAHLAAYPWIRERVAAGKLSLHGWYFDLEAGTLSEYDPEKGEFSILVGKG